MPIYLLLAALLVPINIWAAITPHLHSVLSMRVLHLTSSLILVPPLLSLWLERGRLNPRLLAAIYAVFLVVMLVVNLWITAMGMGVQFGWLDHLLLSLAAASLVAYYLIKPEDPRSSEQA